MASMLRLLEAEAASSEAIFHAIIMPSFQQAQPLQIKIELLVQDCEQRLPFKYRVRAIISRGLYTFYPILEDHFFVFKEVFSENSVFFYGLYSRPVSNQERVVMARKR